MWNDYICPWAYAARPLSGWLENEAAGNDISVTPRSFELHPEIPLEGSPVRSGGRLDKVFDHIADECATAGIEFSKPSRSPNTHRVLQLVEIVQSEWPGRFSAVDDAFARAHWVEGLAIDDPEIIANILKDASLDPEAVFELEGLGLGARLLEESIRLARESGVTGTPAWLVNGMVITGLHPRPQFERWITRILERSS